MKINILTFGITKDIIGQNLFELEIPEQTTITQLQRILMDQFPAMQQLTSLLIAVNSEYAQKDYILQASDEIALIPPVSGG